MDIKYKIKILKQEIEELRNRWRNGTPAMKIDVERKAREKLAQIHIFESVLRRRGELPPKEKPDQLCI
jgi:hypothetical protein